MKMPRFASESSLIPVMRIYQGKAVFDRAPEGGILPMKPCCNIEIKSSLKVTYPHTKCGPLRDFIMVPLADSVLSDVERAIGQSVPRRKYPAGFLANKLTTLGKTVLDQQVCVTSS